MRPQKNERGHYVRKLSVTVKRALTLFTAALLVKAGAVRSAGEATSSEKPNILVLFAGDQRADTTAALGNSVIKTPKIDRLVRRGLAFNRAYMQGSFIEATCVPSRAMMLSGQNLFNIDETLMRGETWLEGFAREGYTTFISGKSHNNAGSLSRSIQIARSMFKGGMTKPMKGELRDVVGGKLEAPRASTKHACEIFSDETVRFINDHKGSPFFAFLPFDPPHDPRLVPSDFTVSYGPGEIPLPQSFPPQHPRYNVEMMICDELLLPWPRRPAQVQAMRAELTVLLGREMQRSGDWGTLNIARLKPAA
jgi:arylsulfatase A-like enzyme